MAQEDPFNPNPVVAPSPKAPNIPEIASFEAEPRTINEGQSVRLHWRTANAERVWLGERDPGVAHSEDPIREQRDVDPSGASPVTVTPKRDTTYVLRAEKGDQSTSKIVTVLVRPAPPTFCSVSGRIIGNSPSYRTFVELRQGDTVVKRVTVLGVAFTFENVPVGSYRIVPKSKGFPLENNRPSTLGFVPAADGITCRQNRPATYNLQFRIHRYSE